MRIKKQHILTAALLLCLIFFAHLFYAYYTGYKKDRARWEALTENVNSLAADFNGTPSVLIKDLKRSWIIAINPKTRIPSASIVKIPIMAGCLYAMKEGRLKLDNKITLKQRDKTGGSGILKNKPAGTTLTVKQLIELMITISDNTATNILIKLLGFDYLNSCFKDFGLNNTNLSRLIMDTRSRKKGIENYTTVEDTALLLEKIYKGRLIDKNASSECLEILKRQRSKNRIPAGLPKGVVAAHKTGLERGICHDVGIVFTDNGDFIICVLIKHKNKSSRLSKRLISSIARACYNYYVPGLTKKSKNQN
jgi:beta-lactamase class A